jgi:hypothetical protein
MAYVQGEDLFAGDQGIGAALASGLAAQKTMAVGWREATAAANDRVVQDSQSAWYLGDESTGAIRGLTAPQLYYRHGDLMKASFEATPAAFARGRGWKESTGADARAELSQAFGTGAYKVHSLGGGLHLAHAPSNAPRYRSRAAAPKYLQGL